MDGARGIRPWNGRVRDLRASFRYAFTFFHKDKLPGIGGVPETAIVNSGELTSNGGGGGVDHRRPGEPGTNEHLAEGPDPWLPPKPHPP